MVRSLLIRGMIAGVLAGVLAFGFARMLGESQVDRAIAFEEQMHKATNEAPEPKLVSREIQRGLGLFTGVVVYGTAFGGLFALVFVFAYGRIGSLSPRATSALLAAAAFIVLVVVPEIKYPANPPSIGEPETIGQRTTLFVAMIVASIASLLIAISIGRRMVGRIGTWNASLVGGAIFIVLVGLAQILLPTIDEVPEQFPAVVLWKFRIVSIGIQALLWTTIGLVFGGLAQSFFLKEQRGRWSTV